MSTVNHYHQSLLDSFDSEGYNRVKGTRQWYVWRLKPYLEFLEKEGVDLVDSGPAQVKRYLTTMLDSGYARSTRNGAHTALKVFYEWLVARGFVEKSPFEMEKIKRPRKATRVQTLIELEALQTLFDTIRADETPMARRDYALILLMFDTGLRRTEAASLQISDINITHQQIIVRVAKNDNQRMVPFQKPALMAIQEWLAVHPNKESNQMFVALRGKTNGNKLSARRVNGILELWLKKAGLDGANRITPHSLRRAFATYFSDTGGDMFILKDILGHSEIETTKGYIINTGRRIQMQHRKHSPVNLLNFG